MVLQNHVVAMGVVSILVSIVFRISVQSSHPLVYQRCLKAKLEQDIPKINLLTLSTKQETVPKAVNLQQF